MQELIQKLVDRNIALSVVDHDLKLSFTSATAKPDEALLQEVRTHKSHLIAYLLRQQFTKAAIPQQPQAEDYAVSNGQRRLWLHHQLDPESIAYHLYGSLPLEAPLQPQAFCGAITQVIARHEVLRTVFRVNTAGELRQVVLPAETAAFQCEVVDARNMEQQALQNRIDAIAFTPFDLAAGPLLRTALFRVGETDYQFHFGMHHIVGDAVTMQLLRGEILSLYGALVAGTAAALPVLRIQYRDYAAWQNTALQEGHWSAHSNYWKEQLSGELPVLAWPGSKVVPTAGGRGRALSACLEPAAVKRLEALCQSAGATLFMGVAAVLNALLYRYTNQEDIILGTPVAGRTHADLQDQAGFYVNTLLLRTRFNGQHNFHQLLEEVQQVMVHAYEHQQYPFDLLPELLDRPGAELFDVMVEMQYPAAPDNMPAAYREELSDGGECGLVTDLLFSFTATGGLLQLTLQYSPERYEAAQVTALLQHYRQLLHLLAAHPEQPLISHDYLSAADRDKLLYTFNDTAADWPAHRTFVDLFRDQAIRTPQAIALEWEDKAISYAALDAVSNQLAHQLRTMGVQEDMPVPLCTRRFEGMIIGVLAILKAGGAYVPIDTDYPEDRIAYILQDLNAAVVVCSESTVSKFGGLSCLVLDGEPVWQELPQTALPVFAGPAHLAYVIYTSGSTGRPKGVLVEHRGLLNHLYSKVRDLALQEGSRIAMTASYTFDISVWQMLCALICGGTTVVFEAMHLLSPAQLMERLKDRGINILELVPSYLQALLQEPNLPAVEALQYLLVTGEAVGSQILSAWFRHPLYGHIPVVNAYGPTEASDDIALHFMYQAPATALVPVGKPIQNLHIYLLDAGGHLCPPGVAGEICVSGVGVARGYLNRPELTASRFVQDPFRPHLRMYRTGDLGRWSQDGVLEFLGRIDSQVKVRGYRIELGEIEYVLQRIDGVASAVVKVITEPNGQQQLAAYFTGQERLARTVIRESLLRQLPAYMVPAYFLQMESLPLTPNGKIDYKALPLPMMDIVDGHTLQPPANALEAAVLDIWQQVLKINVPIGTDQDFFALGGHSLRVMQLLGRYAVAFGVTLTVAELFVHNTIEAHAALISDRGAAVYAPVLRVADAADYPVSDGQQRLWVISQDMMGMQAYILSGGAGWEGDYDPAVFQSALQHLVARHEILRTVFRMNENGTLRQVVLPADAYQPAFRFEDLSKEHEQVIAQYLAAQLPALDLEKGPLWEVLLVRTGDTAYLLRYYMHHIISDEWSMDILRRELMETYDALAAGQDPALPPLALQCRDFATWQQQQLAQGAWESSRQYWANQLSGDLPVIQLNATPRPPLQTHVGERLFTVIPAAQTGQLRACCHAQQATLFMGLTALLKVLLYRYTGQEDLVIGSPMAGRYRQELENQLGFYINPLPLRTRFNGDEGFTALLQAVKATTLQAYAHQQYPFGEVAALPGLRADPSRAALFDVLLDLHNIDQQEAALPELDGVQEGGSCYSKFDLTFIFVEQGGGLYLSTEYNTALFDRDFISQFLLHLRNLLDAVLQQPELPLHQLQYLGAETIEQLLHAYQGEVIAYTPGATIMDRISEQVVQQPDAIALQFHGERFSYRQLDQQSNQVAHYLRRKGVQEGSMVPVCLDRCSELIICILGILKAGATFVPVDPTYPEARIRHILDDISAGIIITQTDYRDLLEDYPDLARFYANRDWIAVDMEAVTPLTCTITPQHIAYVIFTSGSTGRPKGVPVTHHSLYNYFDWCCRSYLTDPQGGHFGLFTSLSFDLTITSLFGALVQGKRLYVYPQEMDVAEVLEHYLRPESGMDIIKLTPAHISVIAALQSVSTGLRRAVVGGEQLHPHQVQALLALNPDMIIYNEYGPTEATVGCCVSVITRATNGISIGLPINNTQMYVLDTRQQLLPSGVPGELCISGDGLAEGYLHLEELTAQKFVPHPFLPGARLYRTGDLAWRLPDGQLACGGRMDGQVKINGYRIETDEVEAALLRIPGVTGAVVNVLYTASQPESLAAYFTAEQDWDYTTLRRQLAERLPVYMIPAHLVALNVMPVNEHGKINRRQLPDPRTTGQEHVRQSVAPRNDAEQLLVTLYRDFFQDGHIGIRDNFFELGGNSMKAVALSGRLKQLGYATSINDIMKYPVVEDLARAIIIHHVESSADRIAAAVSEGREWPLSYNQAAYLHNQEVVHSTGSLVFHLEHFSQERFLDAYRLTIADIDVLRLCLQRGSEGITQIFRQAPATGNTLHFHYQPALQPDDEVVQSLRRRLKDEPFDLFNGEVMKCGVLHNNQEAYVLLVIHHIATDMHANHAIAERFKAHYEGRAPIAALQSYAAFITQQQAFLQSAAGQVKQQYWQTLLQPALLQPLPPAPQDTVMLVQQATLAGPLLERLRQLCRDEQILPSVFMLAAFYQLCMETNDLPGLLMQVVVNGRDIQLPGVDAPAVAGQLVNGLPLYLGRMPVEEPLALLQQLQTLYLESRSHQEVPLEAVREQLLTTSGTDLHDLRAGSFNYLHYADSTLEELPSPQCFIEKSLYRHHARLLVKCMEYQNCLQLEFKLRCDTQAAHQHVRHHTYLHQLQDIIQRMFTLVYE